jgi:uncharacterized membrane protein
MKPIVAVPITLFMLYRAWSKNSLTPLGLVAAAFTAAAHAVHPWSLSFGLLFVFFFAGTRVTKVQPFIYVTSIDLLTLLQIKHDVKAKLTLQSTGSAGGEGARTHVQVLANSGVASILTVLHAYQLSLRSSSSESCLFWGGDLLVVGIIANYAAVAADTFSSELGILSTSQPRLITSWKLRKVPKGTNGGVTLVGLAAGLLGSLIIVTAAMVLIPFCGGDAAWTFKQRQRFTFAMTLWGAFGSVVDSFLGGWLQQSVVDTRTGRVVEGEGGKRVLVSKAGPNSMHFKKEAEVKQALLDGDGKEAVKGQVSANQKASDRYDAKKKFRKSSFGDDKPSRVVESGLGLLDNNEVNFLMAVLMSVGAMGVASWVWEVPMESMWPL